MPSKAALSPSLRRILPKCVPSFLLRIDAELRGLGCGIGAGLIVDRVTGIPDFVIPEIVLWIEGYLAVGNPPHAFLRRVFTIAASFAGGLFVGGAESSLGPSYAARRWRATSSAMRWRNSRSVMVSTVIAFFPR